MGRWGECAAQSVFPETRPGMIDWVKKDSEIT
jgi:hypothetical protein